MTLEAKIDVLNFRFVSDWFPVEIKPEICYRLQQEFGLVHINEHVQITGQKSKIMVSLPQIAWEIGIWIFKLWNFAAVAVVTWMKGSKKNLEHNLLNVNLHYMDRFFDFNARIDRKWRHQNCWNSEKSSKFQTMIILW